MKNTLIAFFTTASFFGYSQKACDTCLSFTELGISFPAVKDEIQRDFSEPLIKELGVKKVRIAENWSLREPSQGSFNWGPIDERLNWAEENGFEVLLTIQSNGADWACSSVKNERSCVFNDNSDFKFYIDSLLKRHGDRIDKIQFGNEWQAKFWYEGSASDFVEAHNVLYDAVQEFAPEVEVVLGGFTTISLRWLAACNGKVTSFTDDEGESYDSTTIAQTCPTNAIQEVKQRIEDVLRLARYDLVDIHLYDDYEQWDEYYRNFKEMVTKPIIVSEFGGPNLTLEPSTDEYQTQRFYGFVKKLDSLKIPEAYFFKLVEGTANDAHINSGLIDDTTLTKKPVFYLFKAFNSNITGITSNTFVKQKLSFYPNPSDGSFTIDLNEFTSGEILSIRVKNAKGETFLSRKLRAEERVLTIEDLDLPTGVYFVQVFDKELLLISDKIIFD